jgi:hypothetical protein
MYSTSRETRLLGFRGLQECCDVFDVYVSSNYLILKKQMLIYIRWTHIYIYIYLPNINHNQVHRYVIAKNIFFHVIQVITTRHLQ